MTTLMKAPDGTLLDTPEALLTVRSDAPAGVPIDAIDCAVARANAVLLLIMGQFESDDSQTFSNKVITESLWAVQGILQEIGTMANNAHQMEQKSE